MDTLESIGIVVGIVMGTAGFVLGGLSLLHQWCVTRPHIKVRPHVFRSGGGIAVISNVGHIPVFGDHLGYLKNRRDEKGFVLLPHNQDICDKWTSNHELEPQNGDCLCFKLDDLPEEQEVGVIYAQTIVGDRWMASRRDMRRFRKQLAELRQQPTQPPPAGPCTSPQESRTPA